MSGMPGEFIPGGSMPGGGGPLLGGGGVVGDHTVPTVMALSAAGGPENSFPTTMALSAAAARTVASAMALAAGGARYVPTAMALSETLPTATRAPRRGTQMPYIMSALTSLYDLDPAAAKALAVTGGGVAWRVDGDLFEVTGGSAPFTCDLREFTLGQLATEMAAAGYTAAVATGWADVAATTLLDGLGRFADDTSLYAFTSVLYRLLRSVVLVWDRAADDLDLGIAQMDLRQAEGIWLDHWGALYGVARHPVEDDDLYRARIVYYTLKPRANGVAIRDAILAIFGIDADVADDSPIGVAQSLREDSEMHRAWAPDHTVMGRMWPGYPPAFTVALPVGTPPPTVALIADLVEHFRAAGVRATVKIAGS